MGQADKAGTPEVQIKSPSLTAQVFGGTASLLGAIGIVAFLLYFLVAAGDLFLLVPGVFLALNTVEGTFITPMLLGRRLTLNPVAVFIGLLFWWHGQNLL